MSRPERTTSAGRSRRRRSRGASTYSDARIVRRTHSLGAGRQNPEGSRGRSRSSRSDSPTPRPCSPLGTRSPLGSTLGRWTADQRAHRSACSRFAPIGSQLRRTSGGARRHCRAPPDRYRSNGGCRGSGRDREAQLRDETRRVLAQSRQGGVPGPATSQIAGPGTTIAYFKGCAGRASVPFIRSKTARLSSALITQKPEPPFAIQKRSRWRATHPFRGGEEATP